MAERVVKAALEALHYVFRLEDLYRFLSQEPLRIIDAGIIFWEATLGPGEEKVIRCVLPREPEPIYCVGTYVENPIRGIERPPHTVPSVQEAGIPSGELKADRTVVKILPGGQLNPIRGIESFKYNSHDTPGYARIPSGELKVFSFCRKTGSL